MSDKGNNWRDPSFKIADIVTRYNEWRKDYFMPTPSAWLDELLGECVRLRTEVERLQADRETAVVQAESDYQHDIDTLRAEVERLRLTDAEREAVVWFAKFGNANLATLSNAWADHAATLRALLARLGGGA